MTIYTKIKNRLIQKVCRNGRLSFAQSGEDMILAAIFCNEKKGFYIDVGANNPFIQSNTYYFYRNGWNGINIDALPESMNAFKKYRKRDINLEYAINDEEEILDYYIFSPSYYNTLSNNNIEEIKKIADFIGVKKVKTYKLSDILDKYKISSSIEFMSVDVEGFDLNVLKSNNWIKYRPKIIIIEFHAKDLDTLESNAVHTFLNSKGYNFLCNTTTNFFYIERNYLLTRYNKTLNYPR